jgi:hypothetical protein
VDAVAARVEGDMILAGGVEGVYRSGDGGAGYENTSSRVFTRNVTIPDTWLFCSGEHDIQVVSEDEAK